jgi:hypothetical protein
VTFAAHYNLLNLVQRANTGWRFSWVVNVCCVPGIERKGEAGTWREIEGDRKREREREREKDVEM